MAKTNKSRGKAGRMKKSPAPTNRNISAKTTVAPVATTLEAKPDSSGNGITWQAIAEAAYFLWQQRGGNELVNWVEAEAMLKKNAGARR
jgi:hypothetical protein